MAKAEVLALTGQVQTQVLGPGAFQEVPLAETLAELDALAGERRRPRGLQQLQGRTHQVVTSVALVADEAVHRLREAAEVAQQGLVVYAA